jgi:hypothetical protein
MARNERRGVLGDDYDDAVAEGESWLAGSGGYYNAPASSAQATIAPANAEMTPANNGPGGSFDGVGRSYRRMVTSLEVSHFGWMFT